MKIRFSKTLAAVLAVATITAMTTVTAFAGVTGVVTTAEYANWESGDPDVTITSTVTVTNGDANKQVTYLVADADSNIKFIDQKGITSKQAVFTFTAKNSEIFGGTVTAKFGADTTFNNGAPTFAFGATGADVFSDGEIEYETITIPELVYEEADKLVIGQIKAGNVKEYGAVVTINGVEYKLPAYGTTQGKFCVALTIDGELDKEPTVYAN